MASWTNERNLILEFYSESQMQFAGTVSNGIMDDRILILEYSREFIYCILQDSANCTLQIQKNIFFDDGNFKLKERLIKIVLLMSMRSEHIVNVELIYDLFNDRYNFALECLDRGTIIRFFISELESRWSENHSWRNVVRLIRFTVDTMSFVYELNTYEPEMDTELIVAATEMFMEKIVPWIREEPGGWDSFIYASDEHLIEETTSPSVQQESSCNCCTIL